MLEQPLRALEFKAKYLLSTKGCEETKGEQPQPVEKFNEAETQVTEMQLIGRIK